MAHRGGRDPLAYLRLGAVAAVLLFLGLLVLMVHSGGNAGPTETITIPPPPPSTLGAASPSGSATARSPTAAAGSPSPQGLGAAPSTSQPTATPPATATPIPSPSAPAANPMPNTGPPFPWWMGLVPFSLGLGLLRALGRKPSPVTAGGPVAAPQQRERPTRPPARPVSSAGTRRP